MKPDFDLLIRALDRADALTAADRAALEVQLKNPDFQAEQNRLLRLRALLADQPKPAFAPFFSGRVLARLEALDLAPADLLARHLGWIFRRVALAGAVVLVALSAYTVAVPETAPSETPTDLAADLADAATPLTLDLELP